MRPTGRPTLEQVAARAGVGRGTVSRVINGGSQVSESARRAVEKAIAELGYVPNRAARSLVTQRTDAVALVISESEERFFAEPFFASIVRGISGELLESSMTLWLGLAQNAMERELVEHHLTPQHVDGAMLLSLHDTNHLPALLERRGLPTVLGGRPAKMMHGAEGAMWFVDVDNAGGARQGVQRLVDQGRRTIATIAGPQDMGVGLARLEGYYAACESAGYTVDESLVAHGDFSDASGVAAMRRLLASRPDLDAVFVASDLMAAGALRVLRDAGRRVPEDVAVVAFEDSPLVVQGTDPPLTTVRQPVEEMGRRMARLLVSRIRAEEPDPSHVILDTDLVIRASG